ncbi:TadE/TadG family type IV pilus assembly protein [Vibrio splendidus]|uniref:TadE/TadG family type IV pilus assembly protein n=1 Tax=Vibrio splendidus TaxID=29497 RepID=UPI0021B4B680|nr:TadE/TadG family type IV pilus assembly protein [Vibrio splendidus]UWZ99141.1 pilus assembly protein [Vibrio splendidus]
MKGLKFKDRERGVTTVEFSLGAIVLIVATIMIFEMGYRIYAINLLEYSLRESVRAAAVHQGSSSYNSYDTVLKSVKNSPDSLWSFLSPSEEFVVSGLYYKSYADFIANVSASDADLVISDGGYSIAEIKMSYSHQPIWPLFLQQDNTIERSVVLTLEHEGWE